MCALTDVDIPRLQIDGIQFGDYSFEYVTSLQSSSRCGEFVVMRCDESGHVYKKRESICVVVFVCIQIGIG